MPIVLKSGSLNLLEPSGSVHAYNGIALPALLFYEVGQDFSYVVHANHSLDGLLQNVSEQVVTSEFIFRNNAV
jgi:hypothetical protein